MKKSFEVNLGGRLFNFDEDAYELLNNYMESLRECFSKHDAGEEIVADIEVRLSELCETRMREGSVRIVDFSMIDEFITRMGRPEALAQEIVGVQATIDEVSNDEKEEKKKREPWRDAMLLGRKFFRDTRNGLLGGVFSGLAAYMDLNVWLLRILAILIFFFVAGIVAPILYVIAWLVFPMASSVTDFMRMRDIKPLTGERVEYAWAREYERASAEVTNGGVVRENNGCLSGCIIILLAIIAFPIIVLFLVFDFAKMFIPNYLANQDIFAAPTTDCIVVNYGVYCIILMFLLLIPLFLTGYYILKRKGSVPPLKKWIKIVLVIIWLLALGLFVFSKYNRVEFPFFKSDFSYSIKKSIKRQAQLTGDVINFTERN